LSYSLSNESAFFIENVIENIRCSNDNLNHGSISIFRFKKRHKVLISSLQSDPGIQQLVSILVSFIVERFKQFFKSCNIILAILEIYEALSENPWLNLVPFMHKILPVILASILNKNLGKIFNRCAREFYYQNVLHSSFEYIREKAVETLVTICHNLSNTPYNFEARCLHTLVYQIKNAFTRSPEALYGSIMGILVIGGSIVVRNSLLCDQLFRRVSDEIYYKKKLKKFLSRARFTFCLCSAY